MKTLALIALTILLLTLLLSCKKGDEDPFFTLATRKNRLCGEWAMTSFYSEQCDITDSLVNACYIMNGDGNQINATSHDTSYVSTLVMMLDECKFIINRDYTWSRIRDYQQDIYYENGNYTFAESGRLRDETEGSWAFVNKTVDYKKKERVMFNILSRKVDYGEKISTTDYIDTPGVEDKDTNSAHTQITQYPSGEYMLIYDLLMLKTKQMKWVLVSGYNSNGNGSADLEEITWDQVK